MMYYIINKLGVQEGPYETNKLLSKGLTRNTMVWTNGMKDWTKAEDVEELKTILPPLPPTPPTPSTPTTPPTPSTPTTPPTPPTHAPQQAEQPISQQNIQPEAGEQCPNNYMVFSILTTLLCCLPAGIVAIIYSNKVNTAWAQGNKAEALKSSEQAKVWCLVSLGGGIIVFIISFISGFLGAL